MAIITVRDSYVTPLWSRSIFIVGVEFYETDDDDDDFLHKLNSLYVENHASFHFT